MTETSLHSSSPRRRVLIIDDEPELATIFTRALRDYDVRVCATGWAGVDAVERGGDFAVVICDLDLPDTDGVSLYTALCARQPALAERVLFISGGASSEEVEDFIEETRQPLLRKPFLLDRFEAAVRRICDGKPA